MANKVNSESFEALVLQSGKPVLVDFYADWCGPCRMLAPVIEQISHERDDIKVCKINVDEQEELAIRFKVSSIPTVFFIKDGQTVDHFLGFRQKAQIDAILDKLV